MALFAVLTAWTVFVNPVVFGDVGGGGTNSTTFTTSTSSHTASGCPSRTEQSVATTVAFGPTCIGIGNLDVPNQLTCGAPPAPPFGTPFFVAAGTQNLNTNTDTATFICKPAAPALGGWALGLLFAGLSALGVWRLRHRSA
jgi:hypothetical protein